MCEPQYEYDILMKYLMIMATMSLSACSSMPQENQIIETHECRQYRTMMTAPMPPSEHERLKEACENSK